MDETEFQKRAEELIDYIVDYLDSISQRPVIPNVCPGFLTNVLPSVPPLDGESFEKIMEDVEKYIIPGIVHWQHPRFHAYFPSNYSFPAILAEMLMDTFGCVNFKWNISPSGTELETIVTDWFGSMMGLPGLFLRYSYGSRGAGIIQSSSSDCVLQCMLTARNGTLTRLQGSNPSIHKSVLLSTLVAYCSTEAHSCVEKAAVLSLVNIKILETDGDYQLRGETLAKAIDEDKKRGLVPFFACITIGTTSCCSCDPIDEIGPVCRDRSIWLHVDASYGGVALICPEYRHLIKGIKYVSSCNVNAAKWMLMNIHCTVMFVQDRFKLIDTLVVDNTVLGYRFDGMDWGHPYNRRKRSLKLWFVIRSYGIEGLQKHVRNHVRLAKLFEEYVRSDDRFEVITCYFGLVSFRLKGSNRLNKRLLTEVNASAKLHVTPCCLKGSYVIRFVVCSAHAKDEDIAYAWSVFQEFASELLNTEQQRYSACPNNICTS